MWDRWQRANPGSGYRPQGRSAAGDPSRKSSVQPCTSCRSAKPPWAKALSKRAPLSIAATKKVMRHAMDHEWGSCFAMEAELQARLADSADAEEGVNAFLEKREPNFQGK